MDKDYNDQEKKLIMDWFFKLPHRTNGHGSIEYTCPCGDAFWWEDQATTSMNHFSWCERHFPHQFNRTDFSPDPSPKIVLGYDLNVPWKFSCVGHQAFVQQFNLTLDVQMSDKEEYKRARLAFFRDGIGNIFAFHKDFEIKMPENSHEGLYCTFQPHFSSLKDL